LMEYAIEECLFHKNRAEGKQWKAFVNKQQVCVNEQRVVPL
jgi:hypothetical protein